jgi:hypothetical protein
MANKNRKLDPLDYWGYNSNAFVYRGLGMLSLQYLILQF